MVNIFILEDDNTSATRALRCHREVIHHSSPLNQNRYKMLNLAPGLHCGQKLLIWQGCPGAHWLNFRSFHIFEQTILGELVCKRNQDITHHPVLTGGDNTVFMR